MASWIYRRPWTDYWQPSRPLLFGRGTRLWFPSTGTAAVSPAFDVGWEDTASASPARRPLQTTASGTAMTTVSFTDASEVDRDILMYQGVSLPLDGAQTIDAQSIRVAIRARETLDDNQCFMTWLVKVFSNDGTALRGTIVAIGRDDTELDAITLTSRYLSASGGSVAALDGDRIVVELGVGGDPIIGTEGHSSSIRVGDVAASELPYDDSMTTDLNPFIQFAQTLLFGSEVVVSGLRGISLLGVGT